ncbi:hypothetical protein BABINDRAFT_39774 [Babjeviella inositovora NRRL Y-12698]|uniref:Uncharacterized protein n=1 Tax=Babjeviella inositovora NRRL Y-12698 TaxID=984486 RepID=A0A1E3QKN2_9ASCO|nr:uncharacterized protein BABINDRAFT_39774 [Babjeviella inositovora NRRL Y-12698]ODQ78243.1 hypothetical protein BABINDRAFT_39774 [Babjeviella inositovora NRRL Y-12698]
MSQQVQKNGVILAKPMFVTFDAYGTLYTPKKPIHELYCSFAIEHGIIPESSDIQVYEQRFLSAFKNNFSKYPNYGKNVVGPIRLPQLDDWWDLVIRDTFDLSHGGEVASTTYTFVQDLLADFKSTKVYDSFDDVVPLLDWLRHHHIPMGVASNTDRNAIDVLNLFGFLKWFSPENIFLSYDMDVLKPDKLFFDKIRQAATPDEVAPSSCWHIGDELSKDFTAAYNAGWSSILVDRQNKHGFFGSQMGKLRSRIVNDRQVVVRDLKEVSNVFGATE